MAECNVKNLVIDDWDTVYVEASGDEAAMNNIRLTFEKGLNVYSFALREEDAKYIRKALKGAIAVAK